MPNCGPLTHPTNGQVNTSSGTLFQSTATYTCDIGYTLNGSQSRNCGADEIWMSTEPSCNGKLCYSISLQGLLTQHLPAVVDCGSPSLPANGQVQTKSGTTFGSIATYTCDTGYTLSDSSSRTCGAKGKWSPSEPSCQSE